MTQHHEITLHTFLDSNLASPTFSQLERQQRVAQSICHPTNNPFKTHSIDPWLEQDPINTIPNTRSYSTTVPPALSPSKRLRPRSPSPSIEDWHSLSSFKHWNPPSPSPPPPVPPVSHTGILRKRTIDGKATVGAWSTSSGANLGEEVDRKGKKKKTVRVESPASTAVGDSSGMGTRKSPRRSGVTIETSEGDGSLRRSSRGRAKSTKELVPATPDEGGGGGGGAKEGKDPPVSTKERKEQPELGIGSIKRCIPPPYHHLISHTSPSSSIEPTRQEPSKILHSFVDPTFSPSSYPPTSSARAPHPDISLVSPPTASYLTPGRQGSWLIPLSSPFPLPHSSSPIWFSSPPPPLSRSTNSTLPLPIEWTDSRLKALWAFLTNFHSTSSCGRLRASCIIPPSKSTSTLPEYLKVTMDANLALNFRTLLSLFSVAQALAMRLGPQSGKEGRWSDRLGKVEKADKERWLRGRALVWVDEMGRAILVA